jgi:hypothetical protein
MMKQTVDARDWDPTIRAAIENLIAVGGGRLLLSNKDEAVVMSRDLWNLIEPHLPSLADILEEGRRDE